MTGQQFNTLISAMYVGYVLMQVPSCVTAFLNQRCWGYLDLFRNLLLDQLRRPSVYLSFCISLWGLFSISTGQWALGVEGTCFFRSELVFRKVLPLGGSYEVVLPSGQPRYVVIMEPFYLAFYLAFQRQCITLELFLCSLDGKDIYSLRRVSHVLAFQV